MFDLNFIKDGNVREKKISDIKKFLKYMRVNVKTRKKAGKRLRLHRFSRHMVANIDYALEFASLQNLFETCTGNRSSVI